MHILSSKQELMVSFMVFPPISMGRKSNRMGGLEAILDIVASSQE